MQVAGLSLYRTQVDATYMPIDFGRVLYTPGVESIVNWCSQRSEVNQA